MDYQGYNSNQGYNTNQGYAQPSPNPPAEFNMTFAIASVVCWAFVLVTGWISFRVPDLYKAYVFWDYVSQETEDYSFIDPLYIHYVLFYMIAISILLSLTIGLIIFCYSVFIRKDGNVINAMQGNMTKFHFIPFICVGILFIIGESVDVDKPFKDFHYIANIILAIIALASLFYFITQIKLDTPLYASWTIKHAALPCLVGLLVHDIGYVISEYGLYRKSKKTYDYDEQSVIDWLKGCQIAFSIIVGVCNCIGAIVLKEVAIAYINLLCYIGMITNLLKMKSELRKELYTHTPLVVDIIIIIISLLIIAFLGKQYRGYYLTLA